MAATDDLRSQRFYHGTRADLTPGDLIEPGHPPDVGERDWMTTCLRPPPPRRAPARRLSKAGHLQEGRGGAGPITIPYPPGTCS